MYDHLRCSWDNLKKSNLLLSEIHLLQHFTRECSRKWISHVNKIDFFKLSQEHRKWSYNAFSPEITSVRCFFSHAEMDRVIKWLKVGKIDFLKVMSDWIFECWKVPQLCKSHKKCFCVYFIGLNKILGENLKILVEETSH